MADYNALMNALVANWRFDRLILEARPRDYTLRDRVILDWIRSR